MRYLLYICQVTILLVKLLLLLMYMNKSVVIICICVFKLEKRKEESFSWLIPITGTIYTHFCKIAKLFICISFYIHVVE